MNVAHFDHIDRDILEQMQLNGRISMKKLGEAIHLSAPAVTERVKRMEDAGVIQGYTIRTNAAAMGYQMEATIIVMLQSGKKEAFLAFLQTEPEIIEADELPGKTDAILKVYCESIERFFALVSRIRNYGATDSYVHMAHYKRSLLLPEVKEGK